MCIPKFHFHKSFFCFTPTIRETKRILKQLNKKMGSIQLYQILLNFTEPIFCPSKMKFTKYNPLDKVCVSTEI